MQRFEGVWEKLCAYYREYKKMIWYQICSFTLILISAIWVKSQLYMLLPIFIAHIYMLLQARASRYMFILSAFNAVFFGLAYITQGLYTSAAYSIAVCMPLNIISYYNWKKRTHQNETQLRRLNRKQIFLVAAGSIVVWVLLYFIFSVLGSPYILYDNTATLIGALGVILGLFSFIECTIFQVVCCFTCVITYIRVIADQPAELPYLINNILAMGSSFVCFVNMMKIYKRQQKK